MKKVSSNNLRIKNKTLFLNLLILLFFAIPADVQTPFRVLLLFAINIYVLSKCRNRIVYVFLIVVGFLFSLYKNSVGTFDSSLMIVILSLGPICFFRVISDNLIVSKSIRVVCSFAIVCILVQLAIYRYNGRPNLSYEINQSASYLFLLFVLCDAIKYNFAKWLIMVLSFLLLSRLYFLCLLAFFAIRLVKSKIFKSSFKFPYIVVLLSLNVITYTFSFWYVQNMRESVSDVSENSSRLQNINDTSNFLRFSINANVLLGIADGDSKMIYSGYGNLAEDKEYRENYRFMPHNEALKHIAQYGLLFTIFLLIVSSRYYKILANYHNLEYIFPIMLYTQFLWVKFTVIPSIEMIFIFYILSIRMKQRQLC